MIDNEDSQKKTYPKDYKFFFIAHLFAVFFAFIVLVLILVKGIPNLSTLIQNQCNSYYLTKYTAKGDINFILSLTLLIINFTVLLVATIIIVIRICKQKDLKHIINRLRFQRSIKIALYILYSTSILSLINPIGFYLQILVEKDYCINTFQPEWIIFLVMLMTSIIFSICCWICTVFYLQQMDQSIPQTKEEDQAISFAADSPAVFREKNSQLQNNSHFFSHNFASPQEKKVKKAQSFNFMKQELQKLKKKIIHPSQSTFQNKKQQNPTLLNQKNSIQEYMDHSYEKQLRQEKKRLQKAQKQFQIFHQQKSHIPGFHQNPYSRLINADETRRQQMKKQAEQKNIQEENMIYQRKKVTKKVLFIDQQSEGNQENFTSENKEKKKLFQAQVKSNLKQKFTNQQQV